MTTSSPISELRMRQDGIKLWDDANISKGCSIGWSKDAGTCPKCFGMTCMLFRVNVKLTGGRTIYTHACNQEHADGAWETRQLVNETIARVRKEQEICEAKIKAAAAAPASTQSAGARVE